jgi:chorismate mutase
MMTVVWNRGIAMLAIDEISIQVPLDIAEAYRQSSLEERQKMSLRIGAMLRQDLGQPIGTYAKLRQTMNKLATEAEENGLTPEILESILNDE